MKVAITGGKGGTGKSTVSTALAVELAKNYKVMLVDADVECPDDHIILSIPREKIKDVTIFLPFFNEEKCLRCGKCGEICKENAIILIKNKFPFLVSGQCTGCGACRLACPNEAIEEDTQAVGSIYLGKPLLRSGIAENFILISGETDIGCESSSPVVNATIDFASSLEENYDFLVVDTAAGTHCNVIAALMDVDLAFAVAEPTPLGKHDLDLILKLLEIMEIRSEIIVNKSNIGDLGLIQELNCKYGVNILSEIPYTKEIIKSYSKGIPAVHEKISEIAEWMGRLL
ncbi:MULTISPECIES: nucleotide-binding protein [Methanobacterium]|jgi:MinD superfamily P-loop ATPase|uniref:P-loop ATPase n=1 Tax=Methanobacterium bryantii TaxID=2161 RepID=A0A2A2H0I7_METBR|nr:MULTISPECIES: ATP-binding protein [Methanobacterium]OEC87499.1 P-loop ATPase [Methanobacterium sp. A39]PAV02907.1 P-loop ATPase [Methanobacterium bryantii]